MARTRSIKPSFFTNDVLAELPPLTRLLFIGLWTLADCVGLLEDRPKQIKAKVLPWDDLDTDAALTALERSGFIRRYEADGVAAIAILKFQLHQHPHPNEKPAGLPPPPKTGAKNETRVIAVSGHEKDVAESVGRPVDSGLVLGTCNLKPVLGDGDSEDVPAARPLVAVLNPHSKSTNLINGQEQRRHGLHAWCDFERQLCVPIGLHTQFKARGIKTDDEMKAWYARVVAEIAGQPIGDSTYKFWEAQFVSWIGTTKPAARPRTLGPSYADDDWFEECKRLHGGACGLDRRAHAHQLDMDAAKAQAS